MSRYKKVLVNGVDEYDESIELDNVPAILDTETGLIAPFHTAAFRDWYFEGGPHREDEVSGLAFVAVHKTRPKEVGLDTFWNMREEVSP